MRPQKQQDYKISKDDLLDMYVTKGLTRKKIAISLGVSEGLIKYYMSQYGIIARNRHSYKREQEATDRTSKKNWRGYGDISMTFFNQIKRNAIRKNRTLEFDLTIEFLWDLFIEQDRLCALTRLPLVFVTAGNVLNKSKMQTASLDRIDSNLGYIRSNVQWVHKDVQKMKWDFTQDRFLELCRLIAQSEGVK